MAKETHPFIAKRPWYKSTARVSLLVFIIVLLLVVWFFAVRVANYTKNINGGVVQSNDITKIIQNDTSQIPANTLSRWDIETTDDPQLGDPTATVVIVEFGDFECPYCLKAFPTVRELQHEYQDRILYIWRDFPAADLHPHAEKAAEAGECAQDQGKFWEYHDKLFINQQRLTVPDLKRYAAEVGMDVPSFILCLDSGRYAQEVQQDLQIALDAGAIGTPTYFINGQMISGVIPKDLFKEIIDQQLSPIQ